MRLNGFGGVDVDYKQARAWLEKAAAQTYPEALDSLAGFYMDGSGGVNSSSSSPRTRALPAGDRARLLQLGDRHAIP